MEQRIVIRFEEMVMFNDLPSQPGDDDWDLDAYNAAFHELGLRWYWDRGTYQQLLGHSQNPADRICYYLKTHQPHLLRAYDAAFLAKIIQQKKIEHQRRDADSGALASGHFDWARTMDCELGA